MSLSTYYMRQAAKRSALQAASTLHMEETLAMRVTPVSLSLILFALRCNSSSPFARSGLRFALTRSSEDVLKNAKRLGAADVRARGDALFQKVMGRHADRAVSAIAQYAKIDARRARSLLAMSSVAAASALSETKRELNLTASQTLGVLISESAFMDNVDPALMVKMREWVFRPPLMARMIARLSALMNRRPYGPVAG